MENRLQTPRAAFCKRKNDQILVTASMEEARKVAGLTLIERQEVLERLPVRQGYHLNGRRRDGLCSSQRLISCSKLLKTRG